MHLALNNTFSNTRNMDIVNVTLVLEERDLKLLTNVLERIDSDSN